MTISFTPALSETVHVAVKHDATSARLRFTAVLFVHEYRYYEKSGAKVQIWADIPMATASDSEGWEARDFECSDGCQSRRSSESSSSTNEEMDFDQVVLSLVVDAPLKATTRSYAFTYRILYPGGEVKWLGTVRTNGEFVFQRYSKPRVPAGDPRRLTNDLSQQLNESLRRLQASLFADAGKTSTTMPLRRQSAQPLSLSELGESELPTILEEVADAPQVENSSSSSSVVHVSRKPMPMVDDLFPLLPKAKRTCEPISRADHGDSDASTSKRSRRGTISLPSLNSPPSERPIPDPRSLLEPKSTPLMLWGWVLDQDIYEPGTLPICSSLSERYERFVKAMKTARVIDAARFKGFVSITRLGQPMSQFCFHFASNRNRKDRRKRLESEEVGRLMKEAGTRRWPEWIEIPGSASPSYLEVEVSGAVLSGGDF